MKAALRVLLLLFVLPLHADARLFSTERICTDCPRFAADVNGDGLDDIIDRTHAVRFNVGGSFAEPVPAPGLTGVYDEIFPGDFNGDGFADVIIAGRTDELRAGDGTGRFVRVSYPHASLGRVAKIVDFDGDGRLDLVIVTVRATYLLRGNGDATFTLQQTLDIAPPADLACGDIDRDGRADLVIASGPYLHFYAMQPGGAFLKTRSRFVGTTPWHIHIADVNGDARVDIVMDDVLATPALTALFGDGTGAFPGVSRTPTGDNRDHPSVVGDFIAGGGMEVARGDADGVKIFSAAGNEWHVVATFAHDAATEYAILAGNFDRDAQRELVSRATSRLKSDAFLLEGEGFAGSTRGRAVRRGPAPVEKIAGEWDVEIESDCSLPMLDSLSFAREGMFVSVAGASAEAAYLPGDEALVLRLSLADGLQPREVGGTLAVGEDVMRGTFIEAAAMCGVPNARHRVTLTRSGIE